MDVRILTLKIWTPLLLVLASALSGCAANGPASPSIRATEVSEPAVQAPSSQTLQNGSAAASDSEGGTPYFAKSVFIANDFLSVIRRVPDFVAGQSRFSATLPRTRYGEILMEQLRQSGYTLVLGEAAGLPELSYRVELPSDSAQNLHTFYVSVGKVHLKRSYEIVDDRIAPATEMLMAGVDTNLLLPLNSESQPALSAVPESIQTAPEPEGNLAGGTKQRRINVSDLNASLIADEQWNPLETNMFETLTSVYDPLFADAANNYDQISSEVLIFPNDSLVLGRKNKAYLLELAQRFNPETDVIRVIGCSHGQSDLVEGNQKLAKGRAVRVRQELMLAGVEGASVLHEACWAPEHFDQVMPRRGVVIMHLREQG